MGAHAYHPVTSVRADLTGLVEEVNAVPRPAISSAGVAQSAPSVLDLPQRCGVRHGAERDINAADLGHSVPGLPVTQAGQAGTMTTAGRPSAARATAPRMSPSRAVHYKSYFDATPPVCSGAISKCTLLTEMTRRSCLERRVLRWAWAPLAVQQDNDSGWVLSQRLWPGGGSGHGRARTTPGDLRRGTRPWF